ncbi:MAG: hypothetical protein ACK5SX_16410 [Sandaracinobacter sp.]
MSADQYLLNILAREHVDNGLASPVRSVQAALTPALNAWGNGYIVAVHPSGSFAKGTANHSGTDIDLFISLTETLTDPMKQIYDTLFNQMTQRGFNPKRQNVSINVRVNSYSVDLVPARRQNGHSHDHTLYRRKADTWTKTNVITHINHVAHSGCVNEIRIIKLWRNQKGLDFPSFYLELTAMAALAGRYGTLSQRVWIILEYLRDRFPTARVVDPANTNNVISDDLTAQEHARISAAARAALAATNWSQIVT